MKTIITGFTFFFILHVVAFSQTTATWQGGSPGRTMDWNNATNWKEGRIPDENTQVIIPSDLVYYPVIKGQVPDIDAMLVTGGAQLTIKTNASLTILGDTRRFDVLTVQGKILNSGKLRIVTAEGMMSDQSAMVKGNGIVHQ